MMRKNLLKSKTELINFAYLLKYLGTNNCLKIIQKNNFIFDKILFHRELVQII